MPAEPSNRDSSHPTTTPLAVRGRPLAVATAIVFVICAVFPVAAGLSKNTAAFPRWWGRLDVGISFVLGLLAFAVMALGQGRVDRSAEEASYRAYRFLIHAIFGALVVFVLCGDRVVWPNCLTGLAWRYWLLLYVLPSWITALRGAAAPAPGSPAGRH
jgi:hypothetical protein